MKNDYVKSSPYFFRRIIIAMALLLVLIAIAAAFIGAPLQEPAEPYNVPNPSKSAWFLLWMQELVSYNLHLVWLILIFFVGFLIAPFLIKPKGEVGARWFDRRFTAMHVITLAVFLFIITLTIIAYFFRGEYWQLI